MPRVTPPAKSSGLARQLASMQPEKLREILAVVNKKLWLVDPSGLACVCISCTMTKWMLKPSMGAVSLLASSAEE